MSLNQSIVHGKEHRTEYGTKNQPFCKAVDETCRNHGGRRHKRQCTWCLNNRLYNQKKNEIKASYTDE